MENLSEKRKHAVTVTSSVLTASRIPPDRNCSWKTENKNTKGYVVRQVYLTRINWLVNCFLCLKKQLANLDTVDFLHALVNYTVILALYNVFVSGVDFLCK